MSADQTTNDFQQGRFNKKDEEESTISLHDLLIKANYSTEHENQIAEKLIASLQSELLFLILARTNSKYFTIHKDISAKQVKRIVKSTNKMNLYLKIIGDVNDYAGIYSELFNLYYAKYRIAAKHNWGIRITIRSDKYNPTSTGTTFTVSYIK